MKILPGDPDPFDMSNPESVRLMNEALGRKFDKTFGEPWQDDSDKDVFWLAAEAEAIRDRVLARRDAPEPKRRWWWPW